MDAHCASPGKIGGEARGWGINARLSGGGEEGITRMFIKRTRVRDWRSSRGTPGSQFAPVRGRLSPARCTGEVYGEVGRWHLVRPLPPILVRSAAQAPSHKGRGSLQGG